MYFFLISENLCKKSSIDGVAITFEKYTLVICTLYVKKVHINVLEKLVTFRKFSCFRKKESTKMSPNFELVDILFF